MKFMKFHQNLRSGETEDFNSYKEYYIWVFMFRKFL